MALPTTDQFLANLQRMRADFLAHSQQAAAEGDKKGARSFATQARKVEQMILKKGGTVET